MTKGLRCAYPQIRVGVQAQEFRYDPGPLFQMSQAAPYRAPVAANGPVGNISRMDRHPEHFVGPEPTNGPGVYTPYQHMAPFEMPGYPQTQSLQPTMDFPMNWLPPDNSIAIDYDNIVGLGIGSLDFFSLPNSTADLTRIHPMQQERVTASRASDNHQVHTTARRDAHISAGDPGTPWNNMSPGAVESYVSSESPRSAAHTVSPSDAPGGLYATSVNGARMPCTIRARRASRLIPGARPIRPLNQVRARSCNDDHRLEFPDVSHIVVDDATTLSIDGCIHAALLLPITTYEAMTQTFMKLCLDDGASFPRYTNPRFPALASLNFCIRLYFENFDTVMPLLHRGVTWVGDYWLLALASAAIGCQYAEADEYAQMVEPLHEFLRRAITVEFTAERMSSVGRSRYGLAFAQAMTLSQVGMLYSGSSRLLHFAKAQHSAMVELARALLVAATESVSTQLDAQYGGNGDAESSSWEAAMFGECKRRVICSIRVSHI